MPRAVLAETHIHPAVRDKIARHQSATVREVQGAVTANPVVASSMSRRTRVSPTKNGMQ